MAGSTQSNPTNVRYKEFMMHARQTNETKTGAYTVDAADSGKVIFVTGTNIITLPSTAVGLTVTLVNDNPDGTGQLTIAPAAADRIIGNDFTAADDKDIVNTLATAQRGDSVTLFGDGALGWYIQSVAGTWAREA